LDVDVFGEKTRAMNSKITAEFSEYVTVQSNKCTLGR